LTTPTQNRHTIAITITDCLDDASEQIRHGYYSNNASTINSTTPACSTLTSAAQLRQFIHIGQCHISCQSSQPAKWQKFKFQWCRNNLCNGNGFYRQNYTVNLNLNKNVDNNSTLVLQQ
jgi:hypothetical protein